MVDYTEILKDWEDLKFWTSGEWDVVQERLDDMDAANISYNPSRENLFNALDLCPYDKCKVMICGQDPYPDKNLATGVAFSVPETIKTLPPSLLNIFTELDADLHTGIPKSGSLDNWTKQGCLLWNVIPSCREGLSLSHDWVEWETLTKEIIEKLREKGIIFVFIGSRARKYAHLVHDYNNCAVIETAHPSPLAQRNKHLKHPFNGSRIFSRINDHLVNIGHDTVDWRL